jgi:hypothetical protein
MADLADVWEKNQQTWALTRAFSYHGLCCYKVCW